MSFSFTYPLTIIGHRGAPAYAPENTISSFAKAIELGVDIIECDVRRCASGQLVVFHDTTVDRITNGAGFIAQKTLDELKELRVCGYEKIPTLHEMLDYIDRRAKVYLELKSHNIIDDILAIIDDYVVHKQWRYEDFLIGSFDHTQLLNIKKGRPAIKVVALIYGIPNALNAYLACLNSDIVCLDTEFITKEMTEEIHGQNMLVYVFTVNHQEELEQSLLYQVDGIITDDPLRMREYVAIDY